MDLAFVEYEHQDGAEVLDALRNLDIPFGIPIDLSPNDPAIFGPYRVVFRHPEGLTGQMNVSYDKHGPALVPV